MIVLTNLRGFGSCIAKLRAHYTLTWHKVSCRHCDRVFLKQPAITWALRQGDLGEDVDCHESWTAKKQAATGVVPAHIHRSSDEKNIRVNHVKHGTELVLRIRREIEVDCWRRCQDFFKRWFSLPLSKNKNLFNLSAGQKLYDKVVKYGLISLEMRFVFVFWYRKTEK